MFNNVSVFNTILGSDILMLPIIIFIGFHDSHSRESNIIKRTMMSASSKTIQSIDHHHVEVIDILLSHHVDVTRQIPGGRVYFATGEAPYARFPFGLRWT